MFTTGEIKARLAFGGVPELAALALPDGVVGQHDKAALDQVDVQRLIRCGGLADGRMAARTEDGGRWSLELLGFVQQGWDEVAGQALEDQLFDGVIVRLDPSCDFGRGRPLG